jgi:hypothetical protein
MFKNAMALHGSEVYLIVVGTRSSHALERFLVIKKYRRRRKEKKKKNAMAL